MKAIANFVLFGFLLLKLSACSWQPPLSGTIQLDDSDWNQVVYLVAPANWKAAASSYVGTVLDSAQIDENGQFAFEQMPAAQEPVLWQLAVQRQGERFLNRLDNEVPALSNYMPLVWQDGYQEAITASISRFQESFQFIDPNPQNALLVELRDLRLAAHTLHLGAEEDQSEHALLEEEEAMLAYQKSLMQFAATSEHLLPSLVAVRWASIEGYYERFPELIVRQAERWQVEVPDHPWVQQLANAADRKKMPVLLGDQIPDYPMPLLGGDTVRLNTLLGERLTLLDLWASWCGPCRVQNKEYLVPLWEEYAEAGFQILGYGLEASERAWLRAIEADGVQKWPHASDLMGDDSPLFDQLRISTIPANFLLDAEGKVVAKNLHGEALVDFIRDYLRE